MIRCLRHLRRVRLNVFLATLFLIATAARGQEQESKLLDRLLKPNITLANRAQSKQFIGGTEPVTRPASVRSFFFRDRAQGRVFLGTRQATVRDFNARDFSGRARSADLSSRGEFAGRVGNYPVPGATDLRTSSDSRKLVNAADYSGNHAFRGRGKSQKILSAQDKPMSIDEVRELLNKSK